MSPLNIARTELTPLVRFEPVSGILKFEGKMIPENIDGLFLPINEWIDGYLKENKPLTLLFRLYYYNTSAFKRLYNLCKKLNVSFKEGKKITVRWEYMEDDESSKTDAEELLEKAEYPYEIVSVEG